ncbi:glycosyl hydrolase family 28-related protein [Sphingomonas echinoides]|uniref:Glycosyl hydrolase family 28-related protein n=1 Tax=Sphingomonas echinoides TaxID=59803 RepID=A0ABU4PPI3_9SPHN|nr:glycosyl hydrolase family 28-related protein [Sphingomonas echinoides]MDX5984704.1 glycosyl hydrolase family 28-related protein [Sphingomonas echinoides]
MKFTAIRDRSIGLRGPSFGDIARATGAFGAAPTDTDATVLNRFADHAITQNPGFQSTIPGPADNTYTDLALFRASDVTRSVASLTRIPGIPDARYYFKTDSPPYLENLPFVIKADSTPLSVGAWVRQGGSSINFQQASSSHDRDLEDKAREFVSVTDFGAIGDGVTDSTAAFAKCRAYALTNKKAIFVPAGDYRAWFEPFEQDNICIFGQGSSSTKIMLPDGATHTLQVDGGPSAASGPPCIIDFGHIGKGNEATGFSSGYVAGLTLDGNAGATPIPTSDLFGWGIAFTKYSNVVYQDVVVVNCHCGGIGTFIDSNGHLGRVTVISCGNSTIEGATRPGFDVNSSKNSRWEVVSRLCAYGGRLLDNCNNAKLNLTVEEATRSGFIYNNQTINASDNLDVEVTVRGGCADYGISVGANCSSSRFHANIANIMGVGVREVGQDRVTAAALRQRGNHYLVITKNCGQQSAIIEGDDGIWTVLSTNDGRAGSVGANFAVDIVGDRNTVTASITDNAVPAQVRGLVLRSGATDNVIIGYRETGTVQPYNDFGTRTLILGYAPSGWSSGTGTPNTGAFAAYSGTTIAAAYSQAQVQALSDAVRDVSQRALALEQAARRAGVIS